MTTLIYVRTHLNDPANQGVSQKYAGIARGFEKNGIKTDTVSFGEKGLLKNDRPWLETPYPTTKSSIGHARLFYLDADRLLQQNVNISQYNFLLIRYFPTNFSFLKTLETLKNQNPALRILLEFPTWPYDAEYKSLQDRVVLSLDRRLRRRLAPLVDYALHYGTETEIWGIPTIPILNGIDPELVPLLPERKHREDNTLRLLALGNWSEWHGLDRLLKAMPDAPEIQLRVLGNGKALPFYRKIVEQSGLTHRVSFEAPVQGAALQEALAWADMGVGTLGLHRKGVALNQSLKHRLYCLAGLPFFYSSPDPGFPEAFPFALQLPAEDGKVEMQAISAFYKDIVQREPDFRTRIRKYALDHLSWEGIVAGVLEKFG